MFLCVLTVCTTSKGAWGYHSRSDAISSFNISYFVLIPCCAANAFSLLSMVPEKFECTHSPNIIFQFHVPANELFVQCDSCHARWGCILPIDRPAVCLARAWGLTTHVLLEHGKTPLLSNTLFNYYTFAWFPPHTHTRTHSHLHTNTIDIYSFLVSLLLFVVQE